MTAKRHIIVVMMAAASCRPAAVNELSRDIVYVDSRGDSAWIFTEKTSASDDISIRSDQVGVDRYSFQTKKVDGVSCAMFSDGLMALGFPENSREGKEFKCGDTSFKITKCFDEKCRASLIAGEWRTGISPDYRLVPFSYIYSRCFGVTSISLVSFNHNREYVGTDLNLRSKMGIIPDVDGVQCKESPIAKLF